MEREKDFTKQIKKKSVEKIHQRGCAGSQKKAGSRKGSHHNQMSLIGHETYHHHQYSPHSEKIKQSEETLIALFTMNTCSNFSHLKQTNKNPFPAFFQLPHNLSPPLIKNSSGQLPAFTVFNSSPSLMFRI